MQKDYLISVQKAVVATTPLILQSILRTSCVQRLRWSLMIAERGHSS